MSEDHEHEEEIEAEVAEVDASGAEIVAAGAGGSQGLTTIWGTRDPQEIVQHVGNVADALKSVIDRQELSKNLGGKKDHVEIEGWQTAATLLGLQAMTIVTMRVEPKTTFTVRTKRKKWGMLDGKRQVIEENEHEWDVEGWSYEAISEVRTMDGRTVGRGEAICSREESNWFDSEESAVKGMAQTRAQSRALRQALGFIVGMAGYNTTPKEEMDAAGVGAEESGGGDPAGGFPAAGADLCKRVSNALCWLLPEAEAEKVWNDIVKLFDSRMPVPVAEALMLTIGARKTLDSEGEEEKT